MAEDDLPPCVDERVTFMAPFPITRTKTHPYAVPSPETHGHFLPTRFVQPAYSAACVPFRWMLREKVEGSDGEAGLAELLQLGWEPNREPVISKRDGSQIRTWVQDRDNQLVLLDTFFGALRPDESLCFFYAKRTPLSDQPRRVIVGVGRVLSVGAATEYAYNTKTPPLRSLIWERNVVHSIRPEFTDGFLFPYHEVLTRAEREGIDPEQFVAFAPEEYTESYSYGCELLSHDGAVASLIACASALYRIREKLEGPWDDVLGWVNKELNRLWKARGPFPGLGSALTAFGYQWGFRHGSLLAYEIELLCERLNNPDRWAVLDKVMKVPKTLQSPIARLLSRNLRNAWRNLRPKRRALLELLSRCAISEEQALCVYDTHARKDAGIQVTDSQLVENPYLLFECGHFAADRITFGAIDRGLFPDEAIRQQFPVPKPSRIDEPTDTRRVRALVVDLLARAANEGHTLLPQSWIISRARQRALQPPCPLGENVLEEAEQHFQPVIQCVRTSSGERAYQLDYLAESRKIIRQAILRRRKAHPHTAAYNWRQLVDDGLNEPLPTDGVERVMEDRARCEKAAALEQLYCSRLSVLVGPAGTGKTTLLRILCSMPDIASKDLLLLAPTGKARVRLEERTRLHGRGMTIAQFLLGYDRYDTQTGSYFPNPDAPRCCHYPTVIVDECSMLTELQLAALLDALSRVERLVLVGDPRQLPPIGPGRPFVDIVKLLTPSNIESLFPRCQNGYAELTIPRRQKGESRADMLLAAHFSGQPLDPGADAVLDDITNNPDSRLRLVRWDRPEELHEKLVEELIRALKLQGSDDELGFEMSLGGERNGNSPYAMFRRQIGKKPGAAARAEAWQILSPVRAGLVGVDTLNRMIQARFRYRVRELAEAPDPVRKVPRPIGPQMLLYGDKVINVINHKRSDVWPEPDREPYIANGDIGIIVGQYKTENYKGSPWKLQVEFSGQNGYMYSFYPDEFGDEGCIPLELAYCLTVHKAQGSEFDVTFVVLTNPCWLLSRELLYTALTRHQQKVVVLHQGPLADYRRYCGDEHSEIAGRITNLFVDPQPTEVTVGGQQIFLENGLIHRTERGELVRSKSELIIADKLHARGIDYAYEQRLVLPNGRICYPDFTITNTARGATFYWEHLGMAEDPGYRARWERKRAEYIEAGIKPYDLGGGPVGTLIETHDQPGGSLDAAKIAEIIDKVILASY